LPGGEQQSLEPEPEPEGESESEDEDDSKFHECLHPRHFGVQPL
jgi:hypothetical protein